MGCDALRLQHDDWRIRFLQPASISISERTRRLTIRRIHWKFWSFLQVPRMWLQERFHRQYALSHAIDRLRAGIKGYKNALHLFHRVRLCFSSWRKLKIVLLVPKRVMVWRLWSAFRCKKPIFMESGLWKIKSAVVFAIRVQIEKYLRYPEKVQWHLQEVQERPQWR